MASAPKPACVTVVTSNKCLVFIFCSWWFMAVLCPWCSAFNCLEIGPRNCVSFRVSYFVRGNDGAKLHTDVPSLLKCPAGRLTDQQRGTLIIRLRFYHCGRSRQSDILEGFDADMDLVCKSHVAPQKNRPVCRVGVWFRFVRSALLLAVGTCIVLSFEAMLGLCCFLRVTPRNTRRNHAI